MHFLAPRLAPVQNASKLITRKLCVHECHEWTSRWLASELGCSTPKPPSSHPVLANVTTLVNTPDWVGIMNGKKGDPHAKEQLSPWLIIGIHKPIPIARAPVSRWWNRWLRDLEASPHCSFVWSIPTTSVISPLIITLPAVEFPWEGMGQRLYARGLHSMKILTHHNWLFCEKETPASNSGNRSSGCKMLCYFDLLPYTPVVFIHFPLGRIKLLAFGVPSRGRCKQIVKIETWVSLASLGESSGF